MGQPHSGVAFLYVSRPTPSEGKIGFAVLFFVAFRRLIDFRRVNRFLHGFD